MAVKRIIESRAAKIAPQGNDIVVAVIASARRVRGNPVRFVPTLDCVTASAMASIISSLLRRFLDRIRHDQTAVGRGGVGRLRRVSKA